MQKEVKGSIKFKGRNNSIQAQMAQDRGMNDFIEDEDVQANNVAAFEEKRNSFQSSNQNNQIILKESGAGNEDNKQRNNKQLNEMYQKILTSPKYPQTSQNSRGPSTGPNPENSNSNGFLANSNLTVQSDSFQRHLQIHQNTINGQIISSATIGTRVQTQKNSSTSQNQDSLLITENNGGFSYAQKKSGKQNLQSSLNQENGENKFSTFGNSKNKTPLNQTLDIQYNSKKIPAQGSVVNPLFENQKKSYQSSHRGGSSGQQMQNNLGADEFQFFQNQLLSQKGALVTQLQGITQKNSDKLSSKINNQNQRIQMEIRGAQSRGINQQNPSIIQETIYGQSAQQNLQQNGNLMVSNMLSGNQIQPNSVQQIKNQNKRAVSVDRQFNVHSSGGNQLADGLNHPRAGALRALEGYNYNNIGQNGGIVEEIGLNKFQAARNPAAFKGSGFQGATLASFQVNSLPRSQEGSSNHNRSNTNGELQSLNNINGSLKASKAGLLNQPNNFMMDGLNGIGGAHIVGTAGSGQTQSKRRLIMHDNLTNSRGTNRIQSFSPQIFNQQKQQQQDYDLTVIPGLNQSSNMRIQNGIGSQAPPQFPSSQGNQLRSVVNSFQRQNQPQKIDFSINQQTVFNGNQSLDQNEKLGQHSGLAGSQILNSANTQILQNQNGSTHLTKHFMQDAIEKKIEKFSSQNFNVQKRVNTSSKFRNNTHMVLGSLNTNNINQNINPSNKQQASSKHGPGSSGGQGQNGLGPISKKKFNIQGSQNQNQSPSDALQSQQNEDSILNIEYNQSMKESGNQDFLNSQNGFQIGSMHNSIQNDSGVQSVTINIKNQLNKNQNKQNSQQSRNQSNKANSSIENENQISSNGQSLSQIGEAPIIGGTLERQTNDKQLNNKNNMTPEIFDLIEKYQQNNGSEANSPKKSFTTGESSQIMDSTYSFQQQHQIYNSSLNSSQRHGNGYQNQTNSSKNTNFSQASSSQTPQVISKDNIIFSQSPQSLSNIGTSSKNQSQHNQYQQQNNQNQLNSPSLQNGNHQQQNLQQFNQAQIHQTYGVSKKSGAPKHLYNKFQQLNSTLNFGYQTQNNQGNIVNMKNQNQINTINVVNQNNHQSNFKVYQTQAGSAGGPQGTDLSQLQMIMDNQTSQMNSNNFQKQQLQTLDQQQNLSLQQQQRRNHHKIVQNRFQSPNPMQQQQSNQQNSYSHQQQHSHIPQGQGFQGGQGSQGGQGGQRQNPNLPTHQPHNSPQNTTQSANNRQIQQQVTQINVDDELYNTSRMHIHVLSQNQTSSNIHGKKKKSKHNNNLNFAEDTQKNNANEGQDISDVKDNIKIESSDYTSTNIPKKVLNVNNLVGDQNKFQQSKTNDNLAYESDDDGKQSNRNYSSTGINIIKSLTDKKFTKKQGTGSSSQGGGTNLGNQSSRSYDSSDQKSTKKEMIRFLSRILDKNKPLFVFNTRLGADDSENEAGTPSFSMITLIHENE